MFSIEEQEIKLSAEKEMDFKKYLKKTLMNLIAESDVLFNTDLPIWRREYEAKPLEDKRTFPFENACNLVVPIVGIHTDTLKSRVMASIFKTYPIWPVDTTGSFRGKAEKPAKALETALTYYVNDPWEFDLYSPYSRWLSDVIPYGTGFLKTPYVRKTIGVKPDIGDMIEEVVYEGVKPEHIPFNKFLSRESVSNLDDSTFKSHIHSMNRLEVEDLKDRFDSKKVDQILIHADRVGHDEVTQQTQADANVYQQQNEDTMEWDLHEVHLHYKFGADKFKVRAIAFYHVKSDVLLQLKYTEYPQDPFTVARLLERSGCLHGYGMCKLLGHFQEEISQIHCQRRDAQTVANAKMLRVSPNSKITPNYQIVPGGQIPAEQGEVEMLAFGEPSSVNIDEEKLALDLAERRSGVNSPLQGAGAGSFNKKGNYTAGGTFSVLQEGNNRVDLNISDFRKAHVRVGRLIVNLMAKYQDNADRYAMFGQDAEQISTALKAIKNKEMLISASQSNASVNRELEKQTDIMLVNMLKQHYSWVEQMMVKSQQTGVPPMVAKYDMEAIQDGNKFITEILRNFGKHDPAAYLPEVGEQQQNGQQQQQQQPQQQSQAGPPIGLPGVANTRGNAGPPIGQLPASNGNIQ